MATRMPKLSSAAFGVEALGVSGRADGFEDPDGIAEFGLLIPEPRTFLADERRVRCGTCGGDQGLGDLEVLLGAIPTARQPPNANGACPDQTSGAFEDPGSLGAGHCHRVIGGPERSHGI